MDYKQHIRQLREQAEARVDNLPASSDADVHGLQIELSIYEEELRAQFEELEQSRTLAESAFEELDAIMQFLPVGIVVVDSRTSIIKRCNTLAHELLDMPAANPSKMLNSYFRREDVEIAADYDSFFHWLVSNVDERLEINLKASRWLELFKTRRSEQTTILALTDITARKTAQQSANRAHELLELFVLKAPVKLAMFDRQMRYINASERWQKAYDLASDFIGKSRYQLDNFSNYYQQALLRGLDGETIVEENDNILLPNGEVIWLHWEVHPWYEEQGRIGGIIVIHEDVTETIKSHTDSLRE